MLWRRGRTLPIPLTGSSSPGGGTGPGALGEKEAAGDDQQGAGREGNPGELLWFNRLSSGGERGFLAADPRGKTQHKLTAENRDGARRFAEQRLQETADPMPATAWLGQARLRALVLVFGDGCKPTWQPSAPGAWIRRAPSPSLAGKRPPGKRSGWARWHAVALPEGSARAKQTTSH